MAAPYPVQDEGRRNHARGHERIDLPKLAVVNAALDDRGDKAMTADDDLVGVETRKIRMLRNLGVDEAKQRRELRRLNERPVTAEVLDESLARRAGGSLKIPLAALDVRDDRLSNH